MLNSPFEFTARMGTRPVIGQRLKEFEEREVERILGACTRCGKCYEVCPMAQYSKAPATDSKAVVGGVHAVLRGEPGTPEALGWIGVCTRSGVCVPACPENVDPEMMMRLARMTALGGSGPAAQLPGERGPDDLQRVE